MLKWYEEKGNCSDVVISTKVRLSRNLKKYPFSTKINDNEAKQLVEEVTKVCTEDNVLTGNILSCNIHDMNEVNKNALVERSILSSVMAKKKPGPSWGASCSAATMSSRSSTASAAANRPGWPC